MFSSTIKLISERPRAHGAFEHPVETEREVFCEVDSVTRSEYYSAKSAGLSPEYVFTISNLADYHGEKLLKYNGVRYSVIRAYSTAETVELTAQKEAVE